MVPCIVFSILTWDFGAVLTFAIISFFTSLAIMVIVVVADPHRTYVFDLDLDEAFESKGKILPTKKQETRYRLSNLGAVISSQTVRWTWTGRSAQKIDVLEIDMIFSTGQFSIAFLPPLNHASAYVDWIEKLNGKSIGNQIGELV